MIIRRNNTTEMRENMMILKGEKCVDKNVENMKKIGNYWKNIIEQLQIELEREKNRGFFEKLFGK